MALPPLRWPGGKRLLAKRLKKLIPEHDRYVEPFVGSGRVFFSKKPVRDNVIADANCKLIDFYGRARKRGAFRGCSPKAVMSREYVTRAAKKYAAGKQISPCEFLALNQGSYGGNMERAGNPDPARGSHFAAKIRRDDWARMLRGTRIVCGDFATVMRKYDGRNTFFYLDPPYDMPSAKLKELYGKEQGKSIVGKVFIAARRAKGRVMISYNRSPIVEKLFCKPGSGFKCLGAKTKYDMGQVKARRDLKMRSVGELVILNYDPRTGTKIGGRSTAKSTSDRRSKTWKARADTRKRTTSSRSRKARRG